MAEVLAVKIAQVENFTAKDGKQIETAIFKRAVESVEVNELGAVGNDVGDKKHHGGVEKALFFMSAKSLEKLTALLGLDYDYLQTSRFGENFVVSEFDEENVYIGDQFRIGSALVEVCQPRKPCNTLSQATGVAETRKVVVETGLVGWYVRVLENGVITKGDAIERVKQGDPEFSIAQLHRCLSQPAKTLDAAYLTKALNSPILAQAFKNSLEKQFVKLQQNSSDTAFFTTPEF